MKKEFLHFSIRTIRNKLIFVLSLSIVLTCLVKLGDVEKIPRLVSALSALMRSTMDHSSVSGTLSEELQLVSHYITIQQIRFGSRLHYEQECPAALYDARIPRLLLQPLVENAVKYALEPSEDSCSIRIQMTCSETNLQITVADNGPGIPTARLTAIRQDQAAPSGSGIGLRNLKERSPAAVWGYCILFH